MYMEGGDFLTDAFTYNNMGASGDFQNGIGTVTTAADAYKIASWLSTASVVFNEKYFLNITSNYSGSTRLGENNKWGLFPSIGGGVQWDKGIPFFSYLKVRASWGKAGNIPQQSNLSSDLISPQGYVYSGGNYTPAYATSRDGNPNLKWEEKSEINIGADFTFMNDRLSGSIDWFNNKASDLISRVNIASPPNLSNSTIANVGEIQNKGLEINLNVVAKRSLEFNWDFNFNLSQVTSKVNSLSGNGFTLAPSGEMNIGVIPDASGCGSHGIN
jgi:iron complex outermembrane receptor protein